MRTTTILTTEDDGSCIEAIFGCLEFGACNYDMGANTDDGSCEYDSCTGCLSAAACNYDPEPLTQGV